MAIKRPDEFESSRFDGPGDPYGEMSSPPFESTAERAAETVSDAAREVSDRVQSGVERTKEWWRESGAQRMAGQVGSYAKDNPAFALLIAAAAGFVVGRLMSRT
jgi:ElaB/YqjD/DUF883 family membrane-anchored ribosome-binding protein